MEADMKRGRPILEEVVLAKYDGERPTKPFLTPVRGGCTPTLTHVSFENMGRGKNQGYQGKGHGYTSHQIAKIPTNLKIRT